MGTRRRGDGDESNGDEVGMEIMFIPALLFTFYTHSRQSLIINSWSQKRNIKLS